MKKKNTHRYRSSSSVCNILDSYCQCCTRHCCYKHKRQQSTHPVGQPCQFPLNLLHGVIIVYHRRHTPPNMSKIYVTVYTSCTSHYYAINPIQRHIILKIYGTTGLKTMHKIGSRIYVFIDMWQSN